MYRIDSGIKFINGERVDTFIRGIIGENTVMEVEAGTNGYHGGDRENGSRMSNLYTLVRAQKHAFPPGEQSAYPLSRGARHCGTS